nr:uncharacterized protein LOC111772972 [Equus caballus]
MGRAPRKAVCQPGSFWMNSVALSGQKELQDTVNKRRKLSACRIPSPISRWTRWPAPRELRDPGPLPGPGVSACATSRAGQPEGPQGAGHGGTKEKERGLAQRQEKEAPEGPFCSPRSYDRVRDLPKRAEKSAEGRAPRSAFYRNHEDAGCAVGSAVSREKAGTSTPGSGFESEGLDFSATDAAPFGAHAAAVLCPVRKGHAARRPLAAAQCLVPRAGQLLLVESEGERELILEGEDSHFD